MLAGERLYLDVKRMEMAYLDLNKREYELTRHVSLLQVNPQALLQLRATGRCAFSLPESLFDMDGPGHFHRRIKYFSMSLPCLTGPYASVNCTLTLLKSTIRTTPSLEPGYARTGAEDGRFADYHGHLDSIVTSSAQNDSGLFEPNLRDERYLPFENSGVISEWRLELPADPSRGEPAQFDYQTISDVILHVRYTAREGGAALRREASRSVIEVIEAAQAAGSTRLFSVRDEFPNEWARFLSQAPTANGRFELALIVRPEHYPFWSVAHLKNVERVDVYVRGNAAMTARTMGVFEATDAGNAKTDKLARDPAMGNLYVGKLDQIDLLTKPVGDLKLHFDAKEIADLWLAVTWRD